MKSLTAALALLAMAAPAARIGAEGSGDAATVAAPFRLSGTIEQGAVVGGTVPPGTRRLSLDGTEIAFAADGRFIIGLDRDQGAKALLVAELGDGRRVTRTLAVAPRA